MLMRYDNKRAHVADAFVSKREEFTLTHDNMMKASLMRDVVKSHGLETSYGELQTLEMTSNRGCIWRKGVFLVMTIIAFLPIERVLSVNKYL